MGIFISRILCTCSLSLVSLSSRESNCRRPFRSRRPPRHQPPAAIPAPAATSPATVQPVPNAMSESPPLSPPPSPGGDHSGAAGDPSSRREPNPGAAPFVPHSDAGPSRLSFGSPEGLCFSISSDSDEDSEEDLHWIPPCSSPKGKKVACSSPKGNKVAADARPDPGGFMADARRAPRRRPPPPVGETDAQLHATPLVDAEGFQLVVNKHRLRSELRQPRRPPARRPVPADLIGRCFNCLAFDHVASRCSFPSRCLRCEEVGHVAKNCKRPRPVRGLRGRGRPVRRVHSSNAAAATRSRGVGRSAASASTASSGSGFHGVSLLTPTFDLCRISGWSPPVPFAASCSGAPAGTSFSPPVHGRPHYPPLGGTPKGGRCSCRERPGRPGCGHAAVLRPVPSLSIHPG